MADGPCPAGGWGLMPAPLPMCVPSWLFFMYVKMFIERLTKRSGTLGFFRKPPVCFLGLKGVTWAVCS